MAFKKIDLPSQSVESPEAMYRDYRNREIAGPLAHQADMLREYQKNALSATDVALQLPTGSGKTLVGLLIAEWRRRRFKEKVAYLCPTKQLVNQVVEQSKKYGIKTTPFTGAKRDYSPEAKSDYNGGDVVAITTYSSLFNANPYFNDAKTLVFDDAHAAENYVAKYWSVLIEKKKQKVLFLALADFMKPYISSVDYSRLVTAETLPWDYNWAEKIPLPRISGVIPHIVALVDEHLKKKSADPASTGDSRKKKSADPGYADDSRYPWGVIRANLNACHIYFNHETILIRPFIPPTQTHDPFAQANQRIYMSATLGEAGELERLWGKAPIVRLPVPEGWDKQGIGRRLFFFPEVSLNENDTNLLIADMIKSTPRSLVLVPDEDSEEKIRKTLTTETGYTLFNKSQMEISKKEFTKSTNAIALLANRYDGIDLFGDECRMLIIHGLPKAMNIQERFLMSRLAAGIFLKDRFLTRIAQAIGRCTRSGTDYSAVVLLGEDLTKFLLDVNNRALLHPEIQAELEFGRAQSKDVKHRDFMDNLKLFLARGDEWEDAEKSIIQIRDASKKSLLPAAEKLSKTVSHEIKYQYALWNTDYEGALGHARAVLSVISGEEVKGYRALWHYFAGNAAWLASESGLTPMQSVALENYKNAAATVPTLRWLRELARQIVKEESGKRSDDELISVIEALEARLETIGTTNASKFEKEVVTILDNLDSQDGKAFELGHERLGQLLGYDAHNSADNAAPDPWWCAGEQFCIVFEDHTNVEKPEHSTIGATKVRQAAGHPNWIRANVSSLAKSATIIVVMISPCGKIDDGAVPQAGEVCYWSMDEFRIWARKAISVVRNLWTIFPRNEDLAWRATAMKSYKDAGLDPLSLANQVNSRKLKDLPTA